MKRCFIIMPFGSGDEYVRGVNEADHVYNTIIKPATEEILGTGSCVRISDQHNSGSITNEIVNCISEYEFSIVDITGLNPNVFYELGVRHSLKRNKTIVLKQDYSRSPFDIQGLRYIEYNPFDPEYAIQKIKSFLKNSLEQPENIDSLVYDVLGDFDIIFKKPKRDGVLDWDFVYQKIDEISDLLFKAKNGKLCDGEHYNPDLILGVTNGGMVIAEMLYRRGIYTPQECILHSLWANRNPTANFDVPINNGLLESFLESTGKQPEEVRILVLDDNSGSADTANLAVGFVKKCLPGVHVRFLPLFYKMSSVYDKISDFLIWNHKAFQLRRKEVEYLHFVQYSEFPYKKQIQDHARFDDGSKK